MNLVDDQTDKIGIRTLVLSLMWEPKTGGVSIAEVLGQKPAPPAVEGGLLLLGSQTRRTSGVYQTTWTFEGIDGDGKSVTFKDRGTSLDYGFTAGFSVVDFKLHPRYQELLEDYQGYPDTDGTIIWPATLSGSDTRSGLSGGTKTDDQRNEMFGISEFLRMEGEYRHRYAAPQILPSLSSGVGFIAGDLPGQPPAVGDRNWLKAPPNWRRRGLIFEIAEMYWLSGPGGWPEPLYRNTDRNNSGGDFGSGGFPGLTARASALSGGHTLSPFGS